MLSTKTFEFIKIGLIPREKCQPFWLPLFLDKHIFSLEQRYLFYCKSIISNRVSIEKRAAKANGQTIGDWEMNTIIGKDGKGATITLVEKKSCYMLMRKLKEGKQTVPLAIIVVKMLRGEMYP
jgi:IS30 family transposase